MNKAFEGILKKLRTVAIESQGNTGMGGELVVNFDDAYDIVHEVAEEYNHGHFGCNSNGEHEKCNKCSLTDCKTRNTIWFGANNNNGWIPCSERLPEQYTVLCCDKYGEMIVGHPYFDEVSDTNYSAESDNEMMYNCVAWQPLPEPYKESE